MKDWPTGSIEDRVAFAIREVRPAILADGGDIHLVGIEGNTVRIALSGACRNCPMAQSTLSDFVFERILLYAPEIKEFERVSLTPLSRPSSSTSDRAL